jgi:hypothetical protein
MPIVKPALVDDALQVPTIIPLKEKETIPGDPNSVTSINNDGLLLYNSVTGCYNYWNAPLQEWWNLCGTPAPAESSVDDCNKINLVGIYLEQHTFGVNNYLQVPLTVTKTGTYTIMATDSTDNGYYFITSGTFPRKGTFYVNIPGTGTPKKAGTDTITLTVNGKVQTCEVKINVEKHEPDYVITNIEQLHKPWTVQTDLTNGSYLIEVALRVNKPGTWGLTTSEQNGYTFSSTGEITDAQGFNPEGSFPQTVKVKVPVAVGQANVYSAHGDDFVLLTTTSKTPSNKGFNIQLSN